MCPVKTTRGLAVPLRSVWSMRQPSENSFRTRKKSFAKAIPAAIVLERGPFLILEYVGPNNETATAIGFSPSGLQSFRWTGTRQHWRLPTAFIRSGTPASARDVAFFGELELSKRQAEIPAGSSDFWEPSATQVVSGTPGGGTCNSRRPQRSAASRSVPFMGEGTRRVLSILLAITSAARRRGVD